MSGNCSTYRNTEDTKQSNLTRAHHYKKQDVKRSNESKPSFWRIEVHRTLYKFIRKCFLLPCESSRPTLAKFAVMNTLIINCASRDVNSRTALSTFLFCTRCFRHRESRTESALSAQGEKKRPTSLPTCKTVFFHLWRLISDVRL